MVDTWATVGSLRADRQERASLRRRRHRRRARAAAGQPDHHRGQLLHRRALRGGRGRGLSARAPCFSMGVFLSGSTKIVDRTTGEIFRGKGAALLRRRPRHHARQALPGRHARPVALLRRDRQARRCTDPREDEHQRAPCATDPERDHDQRRTGTRSALRTRLRAGSDPLSFGHPPKRAARWMSSRMR